MGPKGRPPNQLVETDNVYLSLAKQVEEVMEALEPVEMLDALDFGLDVG